MSLVFRVARPTPALVSVQIVERDDSGPAITSAIRSYATIPVHEWERDDWRAIRATGVEEAQ